MAGLKTLWQQTRDRFRAGLSRFSGTPHGEPPAGSRMQRYRTALLVVLVPLALIIAYFGIGGLLRHTVDTDTAFRPASVDLPANGSVAVAMTSGLLDREIRVHGWAPDDPWFYPTAWLDNMPNFQKGMRTMALQFLLELKDQVARTRGSGGTDPKLEDAFEELSYPPNRWWISASWPPIRASSASQYKTAIADLRDYNQRVASGSALFERRSDSLNAALDRMALSLGAASAMLDEHVVAHQGEFWDRKADDLFYDVQGRSYAAYMILLGLQTDYAELIQQRQLGNVWGELMASLEEVIRMDPLVVLNGKTGSTLVKNHLAEQGFALLRARTQLRELTAILQK